MTFNFFEIKICANMVSNSHIQCDIYFYIYSKYERILMYWSGHFHLIIQNFTTIQHRNPSEKSHNSQNCYLCLIHTGHGIKS